MLGLLQFRHPRSRIRKTGHGPSRVDDDCFPRIISDDDPSIPGHDFERAVRQVFVGYGAVIQERVMTARGLAFLYGDERQCGECQDADPAILRDASDRRERRIELRPPALAILPATKLKAPWTRLNRAEFGVPVRSQENSFSTKREAAERLNTIAVDESYADGAIRSGLDRIALMTTAPTPGRTSTPSARMMVTEPIAVPILPIASRGAAAGIWTEPTMMLSPGTLLGSRNTLASPSRARAASLLPFPSTRPSRSTRVHYQQFMVEVREFARRSHDFSARKLAQPLCPKFSWSARAAVR